MIERDMPDTYPTGRSKGVQSEREVKEGGLDKRYYAAKRHPLSQQFHDVCDAMKAMHDKKQQDYGRVDNPFSNVCASAEWGLEPWVGAMVRATDKLRRLQVAATRGTLANEGVEDSLIDLAVYSAIALVLYRNRKEQPMMAAEVPSHGHFITRSPEDALKRIREMDSEEG
jgi:hypothetical protein